MIILLVSDQFQRILKRELRNRVNQFSDDMIMQYLEKIERASGIAGKQSLPDKGDERE